VADANKDPGVADASNTPRDYVESLSARGIAPDRRVYDLLVVVDLARELLLSWDPDRILTTFLLTVMVRLGIGSVAVLIPHGPDQAELAPASERGWTKDESDPLRLPVGSRLENRLALAMRPMRGDECLPLLRPAVRAKWKELEVSFAAPMLIGDKLRGVTLLGPRMAGEDPSPAEMEFLASACHLGILAHERCGAAHRHEERAMELEVARRLALRDLEELKRRLG